MSNPQQWIPLNGPGSRLPTEEDADCEGYIHVATPTQRWYRKFDRLGEGWTHFCPIPKAPPLPKPVELSQEKDESVAERLYGAWMSGPRGPVTLAINGIRYGRADGRKQLAQEALGLIEDNYSLSDIEHLSTIRALHELLTEAAR